MNFQRLHYLSRTILVFIPIIALLWLINKDFTFGGKLTVSYNFKKDSPFIDRLWPPGRVLPITLDEQGNYYQPMVIDPVYFYLRTPRSFRQATVEITYQNLSKAPFQMGAQRRGGEWRYWIPPWQKKWKSNDWETALATFVLKDYEVKNNKLHFILSSPGLDKTGKEIRIKEIKILLEREPLTWQNVFPRLKNYFKKLIE